MKLTNESVAALKLDGKKDLIVFDDTTPGFAFRLRAGAHGKTLCSWVLQYRKAGASRRYKLGPAGPGALSAEKARALAKEALGKIWQGQDPSADRADRQTKNKLTLAKAVAEFLETKQRHLRPRSFLESKRYLTTGYFKALHSMPIDTITRQDVAFCIRKIAHESSDLVAGQARAKLSAFFVWCMQEGLADANPVIGTRKPPANRPRERVLSDQELAAIWKACGDDDFGRVVKLLILTGCRRTEVGGMRWPEVDLDKGTWTLPAERSKNHRQHVLPLMPMMREIIESVPRMASREQLFGQHSPAGLGSWDEGKRTLDMRLADQVQPWKLHDLRRSVATRMCDIGIMPHVVEQILNHVSGHRAGPAGVYNRSSYHAEVKRALAQWHDQIRVLIEGSERRVLNLQPVPAGVP
jgi:integrase